MTLPGSHVRLADVNLRARGFERERYLQADLLLTLHADATPDSPACFAFSWIEYLAAARRMHRCPADLLVVSPNPGVLRWVRRRFDGDPADTRLCPRLLEPALLPGLASPAEARANPALAILTAVYHAEREDIAHHATLAAHALELIPSWQRSSFVTLLHQSVPETIMDEILERLAKEALEEEERRTVRSWAYQKGLKRGVEQGREQGLAQGIVRGVEMGFERGVEQGRLASLREALWMIASLRGLAVEADQRARVEACEDPDELHRWLVQLETAERFADALG